MFVFYAGIGLCWILGLSRLVVFRRRPWLLWRWAFTFTVLLDAAALTAAALGEDLDRFAGITNMSVLLLETMFVFSAGWTCVYLLTLLQSKPSKHAVTGLLGGACVINGCIVAAWVYGPFRSPESGKMLDVAYGHPSIQLFQLLFYGTLVIELAVASKLIFQLVAAMDRRADPAGCWGGRVIACSAAFGSAVCTIAACACFTRAGSAGQRLASQTVTPGTGLVMLGIMGGAVLTMIGPGILQRRSDATYSRQLTPLWTRLTTLFPDVSLSGSGLTAGLERMTIEIYDGLDLLLVQPGNDNYAAIGQALRAERSISRFPGSTVSAVQLLPRVSGTLQERNQLVRVADAYSSETRRFSVSGR